MSLFLWKLIENSAKIPFDNFTHVLLLLVWQGCGENFFFLLKKLHNVY